MVKLVATLAVVIAILDSTISAQAAIVENGSFENGSFAKPGDANFQWFAPGYTGTLVLPGQSLIANWNVTLSPFDPDQALTFLSPTGPFGLEWASGSLEKERWVDLNRGGDLWRVSQSISTQAGSSYFVSFDVLVGNAMGGARLRTQFDGASASSVEYIGSVVGPPRWERVTQIFHADSKITTLSFMAVTTGVDYFSGPQIDRIDVTPVPEPSSILPFCLALSIFTIALRFRDNGTKNAIARSKSWHVGGRLISLVGTNRAPSGAGNKPGTTTVAHNFLRSQWLVIWEKRKIQTLPSKEC
jgi:hypothetical protein